MATIEMKNITHVYKCEDKGRKGTPETCAVENFNAVWENGSTNALLGPSGCGKTTILNIISGLLIPTEGKILLDGKDVTRLPPQERNIGQVFQFPIVYDTMNVFDNLAFPLRNKKVPKAEIERRVKKIAEVLDLVYLLDSKASELKADEKHRVSLGRSQARMDLNAILFDEPLTDVDPRQKWQLRRKICEEQRLTKLTAVYVTHDQDEALTFAEFVIIMKDGKLVQVGTADDLYYRPTTPFVGFFIGSPGMNVLKCTLSEQGLDFGDFIYPLSAKLSNYLNRQGKLFQFGIRPEFIEISITKNRDTVPFKISFFENLGTYEIVTLTNKNTTLKSRLPEVNVLPPIGTDVWVSFPEDRMNIYKDDKRIEINNI
jgi:glycerol transport system ATP-binding protein